MRLIYPYTLSSPASFVVLFQFPEYIGLAVIGLSVMAIWLQLSLPRRIARMEDRCKDGLISGDRLGALIRRAQLMPMVCTLGGACLLVSALLRAFA